MPEDRSFAFAILASASLPNVAMVSSAFFMILLNVLLARIKTYVSVISCFPVYLVSCFDIRDIPTFVHEALPLTDPAVILSF